MGPSLPLTPPCGLAQLPCPWSCPQVLNPTSDLGAHGAAQTAPACLPTQGPPSLGLCAGFRAASGPCAVSGGPPPGGAARSAGDFRGHSCGCREVGPVGTCRQGWAGFAVEGPLSGTTGGSSPAQLGQRRRGWGACVDKCAGKATPCGSPDPGPPASPATLTLLRSTPRWAL